MKITRTTRTLALAALVFAFATVGSASATAPTLPAWDATIGAFPTNLPAGGSGTLRIAPTNVGAAPTCDAIAEPDCEPDEVTIQLPPELTAISLTGAEPWNCTLATLTCTMTPSVPAGSRPVVSSYYVPAGISVGVTAAPSAAGEVAVSVAVGGGGSHGVTVERNVHISSTEPPFDVDPESVVAKAYGPDGEWETQAGGHPYLASTSFDLTTTVNKPGAYMGRVNPTGSLKDVFVDLPPGFVGNPQAVSQCPQEAMISALGSGCPPASQVGVATLRYQTNLGPVGYFNEISPMPVFNMAPSENEPASFAFNYLGNFVSLQPSLRSDGDYGLTVHATNISQAFALFSSTVTLWGVPADPSHDASRVRSCNSSGECKFGAISEMPEVPFLTNPTECGSPAETQLSVDSWQQPNHLAGPWLAPLPPAATGCDKLSFEPTVKFQPTTNLSDSPSGLEANIHVPQNQSPQGNATPALKRAVVKLPQGFTVNPSSAAGLGACAPAQVGMTTAPGQLPPRFDRNPANCPDSSKLGEVEIHTPLLAKPLQGSIYLASQNDNPFNSLLALYIVAKGPGLIVKLAGKVDPDPQTGQLTATFDENPQLPFEDLDVNFFGGPRGSLRTPVSCGRFTTVTDLTPWSSPGTADARPTDSFQMTRGAGGGACVGSEGTAPNKPSFSAGTEDPAAATYTPFVLKLARADGTQQLKAIDTTLPKGLLGKLVGIPYCSDGDLASAAAKGGRDEQSSPSCPAASQVGSVNVGAGAGSSPLYVPGKAYLAGPYKGAPLSLAIVTPAVAGPFDLGTVVVRTALNVDPETAQIHAVSDPIPTILQGIPLDVRSIALRMDKPGFTLNPTSCNPMAVIGSAISVFDQGAALNSPFQVGGCQDLGFKPKLSLKLKGGTKRSAHPALTARVTYPQGAYANIARAVVSLPHSEFLAQNHIKTICTRVQFAAEQCPAGSIYGSATATTPLLEQPLSGPVYLRSSSNKLPDLVVALHGQIDVDLVGRIDSFKGGIRTSFESVPDAPVSSFVLSMQGGKKGLLENSRNLCKSVNKATVQMDGQNGKAYDTTPVLANSCRKKGKKAKKHRRGAKQRGAKPHKKG